MTTPTPIERDTAGRNGVYDLVVITLGTFVCALLAIRFEWSERLFAWTRRSESFQLDELAFVLLSLAAGLAWFAARRWLEARRELDRRFEVQGRLTQTLAQQRQLAQQFVELQERERKRLARELHDEMGQFINAIKLDAVAIRDEAKSVSPTSQSVASDRACSIIVSADHVHESVARLIRELRPVGLDELGLAAAIEHCAEGWRRRLTPTQLSLAIDERIDRLDEAKSLTLYRAVQEALTNCARHARATQVDVRLEWFEPEGEQPANVSLRIADDGFGADPAAIPSGLGLVGMRERLVSLGGSLVIESTPRAGFLLTAHIPAALTVPV